ncbi:hypothetical protein SGRIM128S_02542 [Streptomyces griseomycini]
MSRIVGRPVPRVEGHAKVTGAAEFTADVHVPGALHGVMVLSTVARGADHPPGDPAGRALRRCGRRDDPPGTCHA